MTNRHPFLDNLKLREVNIMRDVVERSFRVLSAPGRPGGNARVFNLGAISAPGSQVRP